MWPSECTMPTFIWKTEGNPKSLCQGSRYTSLLGGVKNCVAVYSTVYGWDHFYCCAHLLQYNTVT